jgi:hypothetical protein
MAIVLEVCTTQEQCSVVLFCGQKGSRQKIFIKQCFLCTVGSVCRVKQFKIGSRNYLKDEEVETHVRKWLRQQSEDFYAAGFDAMGQVCQCWCRICRENF